jgi:hypothetical protein
MKNQERFFVPSELRMTMIMDFLFFLDPLKHSALSLLPSAQPSRSGISVAPEHSALRDSLKGRLREM